MSDEDFAQAYPDTEADAPAASFKRAETVAKDNLSFPAITATWFAAHGAGAGNGESVAYDPQGKILYRCRHNDTSGSIVVEVVATEPPPSVARVSPVTFATSSGLKIGSSLVAVEGVYGKQTPTALSGGMTVLRYERTVHVEGAKFGIRTSFVFDGDKVVRIERSTSAVGS
ncbi:MAG: hypothetical protein IAI49_02505 [Candidatus Eremiobacteraeota bacterium]|nr:hypothetical protein [Candidatus Eremiobacteraeota bacterium]